VFGLGRGLIDCFFPRMKEDFSNILISCEVVPKITHATGFSQWLITEFDER
jgi:hypothetical protein